jgi:hypothetical protein
VNAAAYAWSCGMDDTVITPYIDALRRALGRTAALGPSLD